jgi:hypothetical protein
MSGTLLSWAKQLTLTMFLVMSGKENNWVRLRVDGVIQRKKCRWTYRINGFSSSRVRMCAKCERKGGYTIIFSLYTLILFRGAKSRISWQTMAYSHEYFVAVRSRGVELNIQRIRCNMVPGRNQFINCKKSINNCLDSKKALGWLIPLYCVVQNWLVLPCLCIHVHMKKLWIRLKSDENECTRNPSVKWLDSNVLGNQC